MDIKQNSIIQENISAYSPDTRELAELLIQSEVKGTSPEPEVLYLNRIQTELHKLLYLYLNGIWLDRKSLVFYPMLQRSRYNLQEYFSPVQEMFKKISVNEEIEEEGWNKEGLSDSEMWPMFLSQAYRKLESILQKIDFTPIRTIRINIDELGADSYENIPAVLGLHRYIRKYLNNDLLTFCIHGSQSTQDYTGFSDLDTIAVIKRDTIVDPERLKRFQGKLYRSTKYLYQHDLLQHHGHFSFTEIDMSYYSQSLFPSEIFNYARTIGNGPFEIVLQERSSAVERILRIIGNIEGLNKLIDENRRKLDIYQAKLTISNIFLIPAIFYAQGNGYYYKREAIEKVYTDFSDTVSGLFERLSEERKNWSFSLPGMSLIKNLLLHTWNPLLIVALSQRLLKGKEIDFDDKFFQGLHALREELESKLKESI